MPDLQPGGPAPEYAAYEAYVMAAPDDLEFPEYEALPEWQQRAITAAADAAYEARARAEGDRLAAELTEARKVLKRTRAALLDSPTASIARREAISVVCGELDRVERATLANPDGVIP